MLEFKTIFSDGSELLIKNTGARWIKSRKLVMSKMTFKGDKYGIYLYVLEFLNRKYYVGITNNPRNRFRMHINGNSNDFVNENSPILDIDYVLLKTTNRSQALLIEDKKTIELINKYGIENISGGKFIGDIYERTIKFIMYTDKQRNKLKKRINRGNSIEFDVNEHPGIESIVEMINKR